MKSFPFDSDVTYDSDGNPEYDRGVDSTILSDFLHLMYKDGVFPNPSTGLQVTASDNEMSVVVNPGNVMIQGRMGIEETERTIVFEAAGTAYDRIDAVVARLNTNHDYRDIDLYVVKGTEASSPVAPDLTRTGGIYELRLANVFIAKNTTTVSSERITDTRLNDEDCGIVTANPDTVDTTSIFNQYQASLDAYMQYVQDCIDETTAGNLQSQIDALDVRTTTVEQGLDDVNTNLGQPHILWSNPSTNQSFAAQDVTLESADYNYYEVLYKNSIANGAYMTSGKIPMSAKGALAFAGKYNYIRNVSVSGATMTFEDSLAVVPGDGSSSASNNTLIPISVRGYYA